MSASMSLNYAGYVFMCEVLKGNARDKIEASIGKRFHPWHWSAHLFPGLSELHKQDPRAYEGEWLKDDTIVELVLSDEAIKNLSEILLEELLSYEERIRQPQRELEQICSPIDWEATDRETFEELLYFTQRLGVEMPERLRSDAEALIVERQPDVDALMSKQAKS
ncbi:hypothetical protein ACFOY8_15120 [Thalassospira xianhensis]|uniref:Uncharacterized protein n=1 Tax=Thalassospira xianhensis MCCC 1A02616 TaxID=1177929 RepID=A0A367UGU1_9PROT|nr:hypothetical protein [Thalassospira xianhensis]RCK07526.1 hypothetical protein TH5_00105 [Thalassospira xianhensis MCCC 1A02616]